VARCRRRPSRCRRTRDRRIPRSGGELRPTGAVPGALDFENDISGSESNRGVVLAARGQPSQTLALFGRRTRRLPSRRSSLRVRFLQGLRAALRADLAGSAVSSVWRAGALLRRPLPLAGTRRAKAVAFHRGGSGADACSALNSTAPGARPRAGSRVKQVGTCGGAVAPTGSCASVDAEREEPVLAAVAVHHDVAGAGQGPTK
jgi:hypothetical protein